jgi:hypothetical protein
MIKAPAARNSMAKSRSDTASREFSQTPSKPSSAGHEFPVDGIAGAGQRRRAQGQAVDPLAAVGQAFRVAGEHFLPGHEVVAEGHRLGRLQVGEAGHDGIGVGFRLVQQGDAGGADQRLQAVDGVAQPQAHVGGHLVVAGTAGVQALSGVADFPGQGPLDVEVDVLVVQVPGEAAGLEVGQDFPQAPADVGQIPVGQHAHLAQHGGMGQGALDVEGGQAPVEGDGGGIALHPFGNRLGKAAGPGGGGGGVALAHGGMARGRGVSVRCEL